MRSREKKGGMGVLQDLAVNLIKDTVINIVKGKIKKKIKKRRGKGKPMTPERIGIMIGKKYLAHKKAPKKTREQKTAARAAFVGKYFGKASYALAKGIDSIGKK